MLIRTITDIPRVKNFLLMNDFTEINHKELNYQDTILADLNEKTFFIVDGDGMYSLLVKGVLADYKSFDTKKEFMDYVCEVLDIKPETNQEVVASVSEPKKKSTRKKTRTETVDNND